MQKEKEGFFSKIFVFILFFQKKIKSNNFIQVLKNFYLRL